MAPDKPPVLVSLGRMAVLSPAAPPTGVFPVPRQRSGRPGQTQCRPGPARRPPRPEGLPPNDHPSRLAIAPSARMRVAYAGRASTFRPGSFRAPRSGSGGVGRLTMQTNRTHSRGGPTGWQAARRAKNTTTTSKICSWLYTRNVVVSVVVVVVVVVLVAWPPCWIHSLHVGLQLPRPIVRNVVSAYLTSCRARQEWPAPCVCVSGRLRKSGNKFAIRRGLEDATGILTEGHVWRTTTETTTTSTTTMTTKTTTKK